jgi:Ni2+-binding GTPase involved in maturation of urease and hydrogenase
VKIVLLVVLKLDEAEDSVPLDADAETQEEEAVEVTHLENKSRCHLTSHLIIHQITRLNNKPHPI